MDEITIYYFKEQNDPELNQDTLLSSNEQSFKFIFKEVAGYNHNEIEIGTQSLIVACGLKTEILSLLENIRKSYENVPFFIFNIQDSSCHELLKLKTDHCTFSPHLDGDGLRDDFTKAYNNYETKIKEDREMVDDFLLETKPMLTEIEELILLLEENPKDMNSVNTYFRLLHTIKGTASCLGLERLANFAHGYEELITKIQNKKVQIDSKISNALLAGFDVLKEMYQFEEKYAVYPHDIDKLCNEIFVDFTYVPKPASDESEDEHNIMSGESTDSQSSSNNNPVQENTPAAKEEKINISVEILSEFLELSGEITVLKNSIFKTLQKLNQKLPSDNDLEVLTGMMGEMHKVSSLLQNQISEMKKVSLDSVFKPMKRVVRDSAKTCNKKVQLNMSGGDLRVDTSLGKLLNNVLVHMLRNSVDHGIELPEDRVAFGKKEDGVINLSCYESGENVIVEIEDDGKGIDVNFIKMKAQEKGLYTSKQLDLMGDNRVYQILFESGFSTAEKVTSVSGRGVGMDMVNSSITEIGGNIFTTSQVGQGSKFILTLPIPRSILIIKSLMVDVLDNIFSIPVDDISEVIRCSNNRKLDLFNIKGKDFLKHHGELIPLVSLAHVLTIHEDKELINSSLENKNVVIVRGDKFKYGLIVDSIYDIEEVVVKKMVHSLNHLNLFMGATFIGDGEVGLILDLEGIAVQSGADFESPSKDTPVPAEVISQPKAPINEFMKFHLVDNPNYCVDLSYVYRFEQVESRNIQFSGNLPLLKYLEGTLPLIMIEQKLELSEITLNEYAKNNPILNLIVLSFNDMKLGLVINEINEIAYSNEDVDKSLVAKTGMQGTIYIDGKIFTVIDVPGLYQVIELFHHPEPTMATG